MITSGSSMVRFGQCGSLFRRGPRWLFKNSAQGTVVSASHPHASRVHRFAEKTSRILSIPHRLTECRRLHSETQVPETLPQFSDSPAQLVIFDKDGTLVCFHTLWSIFAIQLAKRIQADTGLNLTDKIYRILGYCHVTNKYSQSVFTDGTDAMVCQQVEALLISEGLSKERAKKVMECASSISNEVSSAVKNVKPLDDLHALFGTLKEHGVKISVCTADSRSSVQKTLTLLNVEGYIDRLVCGDDVDGIPKPSPHNAKMICEELGVHPSKAVIVGDSITDVGMGRLALLGGVIGVSTGTTEVEELLPHSDKVVDRLMDIIPLIIPQRYRSSSHKSASSFKKIEPNWVPDRNGGKQVRRYSTMSPDATEYDYVIVGAGSAGCVLANRLSASPDNKVFVLEAGPPDNSWTIDMPAALMYNLVHDKYNWYYHTTPQKNVNDRVMYWPRGRVWGGSSSLNAMAYVRGHAYDYDRWENLGADGWSYSDCLPYFKKCQAHEYGEDEYRGGSGPLHVSRGKTGNPLFGAFIEAGKQAGYPVTDDMNGYQQEGFGYMDMTIYKGMRWSASKAYLRPVLYRPNLDIQSRAMVNKIIFEGKRAVGIEYSHGGLVKQALASRDVILSGGSINSPQLLLLSGVGNADDLSKLDIPVVQHLPGVGQNLQDHLDLYIQQECTQPITLYKAQWKFPHHMIRIGLQWFQSATGDAASTHLEAGAFIRSCPGVEHPDIQYHFLPSVVNDHGRKPGDRHSYQVHVGPMRSTSIGHLTLKSRDPLEHPIIEANYLSTEKDIWEMRQCVKLTREILAQKAFNEYRGPEIAPGVAIQSDDEIDDFVRRTCDTSYHPACTNKMGSESDKMTVVDRNVRVLGIENLCVVDASIMPSMVSGNLNGPTLMLAEKAADIILGNKPLPKSNVKVWRPKTLKTQRTTESV